MEPTLLVCKRWESDRFIHEAYTGDDDILAVVESGSFTFDEGNGIQTVGALEAVNFKKGRFYHRRVTQKLAMYLFRYRADTPVFPSGKVTFRDGERIRSTLRLLRASDGDIHYNDFAYKRALFCDIITQYRLENTVSVSNLTHADPMICDAIGYINANIHKKLELQELARQNYLSYVQFARRFKAAVGTTPQDYIAGVRIKKAKAMLEQTELPVQRIAVECGFSNAYYFSNFFHKCNGISPSEFRALAKKT